MNERDSFEKEGYICRRGFFSEREMLELESALDQARPRFPTTLNKDGLVFSEFLHFHSPALQRFLSSEKLVGFLKGFIGGDFWLRKDQTVVKYPGGVEFPWHQDNAYNSLKDAYYQIWIALTDMVPENGGLRLLPGTHKNGLFPHELLDNHQKWAGDASKEVAVKAVRGDVLLFSSMLLHRSGPNRTDKVRRAYVAEYMSSEHFDPYIHPPYFRVARNDRPDPKFVHFYPGNLSLANHIKYALPRFKRKKWLVETAVRKRLKQALGRT